MAALSDSLTAFPDLMTVEQYRQLPDASEPLYELHHGEVVEVSRPKMGHIRLQSRLRRLLEPMLPGFLVEIEIPFRAIAEFDLRAAEVAAVARERWDRLGPDNDMFGAPELVIEIKSPPNTKRELQNLISLCLANGSIECWIVDRAWRSVAVFHRDGSRQTYGEDSEIPLAAFGGGFLRTAEIFA